MQANDKNLITLDNREELLQSLNFSRQKSEKDVKLLISQNPICHDIRNMIFNTINCSQQQVEAQKLTIIELKEENTKLKISLKQSKSELKKELQQGKSKERELYQQIGDQQKELRKCY